MSISDHDSQKTAHNRLEGLWRSPLLKPFLQDLLYPQPGSNLEELAAHANDNIRNAISRGALVGIQKRDVQLILARAVREAEDSLQYHIIPKAVLAYAF